MDGFYSVDNFRKCLERYKLFLRSRNLPEPEDVSKRLYTHVKNFRDSGNHKSYTTLKEANNAVLNSLLLEEESRLKPSAAKTEDRNTMFENRVLPRMSDLSLPEYTSSKGTTLDSRYQMALAEREETTTKPDDIDFANTEPFFQQNGGAAPKKKIESRPLPSSMKKNSPENGHFKTLFHESCEDDRNNECAFLTQPPSTSMTATKLETVKHYLSVNGFDRDSLTYKKRFSFSIDFENRFRNVTSIAATCLVVPLEISEKKTLNMVPKNSFVHEYGLMYPYLLMHIDETSGGYVGTNTAVRHAFAKFVHESSYRSPNGRGYMIMRPMQGEEKTFRPAPLASFNSMSLQIQKPSGQLYNESFDDIGVVKLEHEAWNEKYVKIVTDKFFDRNEFYIGDSILVRGFNIGIHEIDEFANRPEGHEIVELGKANAQGFHNNFYVQAPGKLDSRIGKIVTDSRALEALARYNEVCSCECVCDATCSNDSQPVAPQETHEKLVGRLINASLQITAAFAVSTLEGDVSVLNVSMVGA